MALRRRERVRHRAVSGALSRRSVVATKRRGHGRRGLLSDASESYELLDVLENRQHRPRHCRRRRVLCLLPSPSRRVVSAAQIRSTLESAAMLIALTAGLAAADVTPATPWRHLYLVPVVLAGLRLGVGGGLVTALAAMLAFGPFVLREIEGHGATRAAVEGIVTLVALVVSGAAVGSLAARARRQRERYDTLRAVQRVLADPGPLDHTATRLASMLTRRLHVDASGLVLDDGRVIAGANHLDARSVAAYVLAHREPIFLIDAETGRRARRVVVVPLTSADDTVGALAVER